MTSLQKIIIKIAEVRGIINHLKEKCDNKEDIYIHELSSNLEIMDKNLKNIGNDINDYIDEYKDNESDFKEGEDDNEIKKWDKQYEDYLKIYHLDEIRTIPSLTEKEELELLKKVKRGDELAKQKLIEPNLKLVIAIAKRYFRGKLGFADLIQEGNIGLLNAIENFDLKNEVKFSEYAAPYIRNNIEKAIARLYYGKNIEDNDAILRAKLDKILGTLNDRDARIIKMRYGIDCPKYTLEQVGEECEVTRERVRQIEQKFIQKLKGHKELQKMLGIGYDIEKMKDESNKKKRAKNTPAKKNIEDDDDEFDFESYDNEDDKIEESDKNKKSIYDGLYVCKQQNNVIHLTEDMEPDHNQHYECIRFYEGDRFIFCDTIGGLPEGDWFTIKNPRLEKGAYVIKGNHIEMLLIRNHSKTYYNGEIEDGFMRLDSRIENTNFGEKNKIFEFHAFDEGDDEDHFPTYDEDDFDI